MPLFVDPLDSLDPFNERCGKITTYIDKWLSLLSRVRWEEV